VYTTLLAATRVELERDFDQVAQLVNALENSRRLGLFILSRETSPVFYRALQLHGRCRAGTDRYTSRLRWS
jgi:hypothetical protein